MKKYFLGLALSIIFFIGIGFATGNIMPKASSFSCVAEASVDSETTIENSDERVKRDWRYYLDMVAIGAGGVITALSVFLPIYFGIKKTKKSVEQIVSDSSTENTRGEKIFSALEKFEQRLTAREKAVERREELLNQILKSSGNTEEICRLAFTNTNELVSKGIADKIAKVGEENESSEEE